MIEKKIQIAFAEDKEEHRRQITEAVNQTKNYQLSIKAVSGRDLILQLKRAKKLPALILMDMQMPCCDGLLATIICKRLFPQVKVAGLSNHTDGIVVSEFYAEKGDTFLSKFIITKSGLATRIYNDNEIFEKALNHILHSNEKFTDIMLEDDGSKFLNRLSTTQIITKNHSHLKENEITYLQLNAAGFSREEIAELMNKSEASIKKYCETLLKTLQAKTHIDLINISVNIGIAKLVRIYQPPQEFSFA